MNEFEEDSPVNMFRAVDSLQAVGQLFQVCIQAVERLLTERDALIVELTLLREPMYRALGERKAELSALHRHQSEIRIERDNLKEETRRVRRKLFEVTKAHMACRCSLEAGEQFLLRSAAARETLESELQTLGTETAGLKTGCRAEMDRMILRFENGGDEAAKEVLWLSRNQETCREFQSVLEEQRRALDKHYQPKVERLMKWNKARLESLQRTKQEIKNLIRELQPLQGQVTKLNTQRKCLVKQLQLMQKKRAEDAGQYQEHKRELEEKVIILKTELAAQTNKNDNIKKVKAGLSEDLCIYKPLKALHRTYCRVKHKQKLLGKLSRSGSIHGEREEMFNNLRKPHQLNYKKSRRFKTSDQVNETVRGQFLNLQE